MAINEPRKHTLLITANITTDEETLVPFLTEGEVIRGIPFKFSLRIDNTGAEPFPGGRVALLRVQTGEIAHVYNLELREKKYEIGELGPRESTNIEAEVVTSIDEGLGWIQVQIHAHDSQVVEYQQTPDGDPISGEWRMPLFVVNRDLIRLIALFERRS